MKTKQIILLYAVCVFLFGCATPNPEHVTNPLAPAYVPDIASISNAVVQAHTIARAVQPFNPWAMLTDPAIDALGGLVLLVSGIAAKFKKDKVVHENAASTLATVITKAGLTHVALQQAANDQTISAVAEHIHESVGGLDVNQQNKPQ